MTLHKHIHFIGIGGISMSALAFILLEYGIEVSGSDGADSALIHNLINCGAKVNTFHDAANIGDADMVVYTAAIAADNPELVSARHSGVRCVERADFLGELMLDYAYPVSVSGTHGKTTTTSMLSSVLLDAGLNPTVLVGGELPKIGGNYHIGSTRHLIFEGCEYVDSFLKFNPYAAIILNVDSDHLDYFTGIEQIKDSFNKFLKKIPPCGFAVINSDDRHAPDCTDGVECKKIYYGDNGQYRAKNIEFYDGLPSFDVYDNDERLCRLTLGVMGTHNISNALGVFAASVELGVGISDICKGIASFTGIKRRFEKKGTVNGATIYDDYAHHPTEVAATLKAARNLPHNEIYCVFQPHTYTRTKALMDDFAISLEAADKVIITDIYAAREKNTVGVSAEELAEKVSGAVYIKNFDDIAAYLKANIKQGDVVFTMGAGTVTNLFRMLEQRG